MKIKTVTADYESVAAIKPPRRQNPLKPNIILAALIRILAIPELLVTGFKYKKIDMDKAGKGPYFILMNHSSFIDLKIASKIFFPKRYAIVCTTDALIGKKWLMRLMGCIPTKKFVTDTALIKDILYSIKKNKTSVLMYPEAGYSFEGRAVALPSRMGVLIKKLGVPVVSVITEGAFLRDPLYNGLQKRKTNVSATVKCLFSAEELKELSVEEIDEAIKGEFSFDAFARQYETKTPISEDFRADGLERILYKCPSCKSESGMKGEGIKLFCKDCKKSYTLDIYGRLKADRGETEFEHIPDWYNWERQCVIEEITRGEYCLDVPVDIKVIADHKALYSVGEGRLVHNENGFSLTGCGNSLEYSQAPISSYTLNADYFWYEIGDVIGIGDSKRLYYCFPKERAPVLKVRFAAEELYKLIKHRKSKV